MSQNAPVAFIPFYTHARLVKTKCNLFFDHRSSNLCHLSIAQEACEITFMSQTLHQLLVSCIQC